MAIRRRIGLLVPATNSTGEPDFHMTVPAGVSVHSHHLWNSTDASSDAAMDLMNSDLAKGARYLAPLGIEMICMAGTTNSFYQGLDGSDWMEREMSRAAGGVPAVASSPSIAQALRYFGAKRISVATPYVQWNNDRLAEYFTAAGFDVLNVAGDPRVADGHSQHMNDQDPAEIADFATSICRDEADAIFCACSAWRAVEVIAEIERRTGRLVVTTNQATIWRTLKKIGISETKPGFGRLLAEMPPIEDPVLVTT
ncbi:MAG: aspartate/glutamate racemase family protein [Chloroflexi bacterium]|nr:aspartate/glutamate racemase family protein [Chloroflexota bacterium]